MEVVVAVELVVIEVVVVDVTFGTVTTALADTIEFAGAPASVA